MSQRAARAAKCAALADQFQGHANLPLLKTKLHLIESRKVERKKTDVADAKWNHNGMRVWKDQRDGWNPWVFRCKKVSLVTSAKGDYDSSSPRLQKTIPTFGLPAFAFASYNKQQFGTIEHKKWLFYCCCCWKDVGIHNCRWGALRLEMSEYAQTFVHVDVGARR